MNGAITHNHRAVAINARDSSILSMTNTDISHNSGTSSVALDVRNKAFVTASNCTLNHKNASKSSGSISTHESSVLSLHNCSVSHNVDADTGGGMYVEHESEITLIDSVMAHNSAGSSSGAWYLTGTLHLVHSQVINDTVPGDSNDSGMAYMTNDGALFVSRNSLIANNSAYYGGCIYGWAESKIIIDNSTISGNIGRYGGCAYVREFVNVTIRNNSVLSNNSAFSGAAVHAWAASKVLVSDSTFESNRATYGGAIFLDGSSASTTVESGKLVDNSAVSGGGACYVGMSSHLCIGAVGGTKALLFDNTESQGGAIYAREYSSVDLFAGSLLRGNVAKRDGGGVYVQDSAGIVMSAGSIIGNNTAVFGGGMYLQDFSNASITGLLSGNRALKEAGAVRTADNASFLPFPGAQFMHNTANGMGGALYLGSSKFTPLAVQRAVQYGSNSALRVRFSSGYAVSVTTSKLLTSKTICNFVSSLGANAGILAAKLNVTGYYGLPCDGMLVQALLMS